MEAAPDKLITVTNPQSPVAEAYRTLRTNILFSSLDSPLKTLLVTGAGPEVENSVVLCNLAVSIAQGGAKVIVVDGDLRRPMIHRFFQLGNDKGLTTALIGDSGEALPLQPTLVPDLQLLTSGPLPPNPSDLLSTQKMERVIQSLSSAADLVLFGAPPIGYLADAALLAAKVDGSILVISAGKTRRDVALRAKIALEKASTRLLGVVLDNAQLDRDLIKVMDGSGGSRSARSWLPFRRNK
ncbi:MAG: CpsD/CapB family tyrosine-protein kinase [Chloroflexota bacterium]